MKTMTLATLSITVLTAALTFGPLRSTEPSYHNKKLTAWLSHLDSLDPDEWRQGAKAVRALGTDALPTLAKRLRAKDTLLKRNLIHLFNTYPIVTLDPAKAHHESALEACRILGPAASPLIPEILPFLAGNRRAKAVKVFVAIG